MTLSMSPAKSNFPFRPSTIASSFKARVSPSGKRLHVARCSKQLVMKVGLLLKSRFPYQQWGHPGYVAVPSAGLGRSV